MSSISGIGNSVNFSEGLTKNSSVSGDTTFKDMLTNAIAEADDLYAVTQADTQALLAGEVDDLSQVMINSAKSELALNMVIQVRNKVVDAYNEIMRMQV